MSPSADRIRALAFLLTCALEVVPTAEHLNAQGTLPASPMLDQTATTVSSLPPSNSVSHIATENTEVWIGTSKGLARSVNAGRSWESFRGLPQFANPGIFAIALKGTDTIWASTGFTQDLDGQSVQTGSGYTYSIDNGVNWIHRGQTLDGNADTAVTYGINTVRFLPVTVEEQNVTFDIALSDSFVWIASWSSGLRRSSDLGQTWQRTVLPTDTRNSVKPADTLTNYFVDPRLHNNFLVFSVYVEDDSTIWAGSAGGINKSTDGGISWVKFNTDNQLSPILGNWVIAIAGQQFPTFRRIWTTNWRAEGASEQFGVSYSDDGGRIWKNFLHGIRAYAFAFKHSSASSSARVAYVATTEGIYRTDDGGLSWTRSGTIIDKVTGQRITTTSFFSVGVIGDTVFAGSGGGLVKTIDNDTHPFGETWEVIRTYQPVGNTSTTYAYPNPFSPDDEIVRFHYSTGGMQATVTIEVFDFGMNRVRTVVKDAQRSGTVEYDEIWNGRDDKDNQVSNGVYFYRVTLNDGEPAWGKVMVLQ